MKKVAVFAILVLCVALAAAARHSPYKNKRIIKVRVPPRQYPHKTYPRPPTRYYPTKYHYPSHPPRFGGDAYVKLRPPPSPSAFKAGYIVKDIHHKYPLTYGSGFPHKLPVSSIKFPSLRDEIRVTHTQVSSPSPSPSPSPSTGHAPPQESPSFYTASHVQTSEENNGPIKEIPAPNLGPKPAFHEYSTYGKGPSIDVTHLVQDGGGQISFPATEYYTAFGHGFDLDNQLTGTFKDVKASVEDVSAFKSSSSTPAPTHSSSYEVTEESHTGDNGAAGGGEATSSSQFYYAPDPDPSAPVHKVPPTKISNIAETYVPNLGHGYQVIESGTAATTPVATLSTQELYQLMHGYPSQIVPQALVGDQVVTILSQPQAAGVILQPNYGYPQNQYAQGAQYAQSLQAQYAQGVQAQFAQGLQPQYAQGVQAQYAQGVQAQYAQGVQPQYTQDVQTQFAQGVQAQFGQFGQSLQPQYAQGVQTQYAQGQYLQFVDSHQRDASQQAVIDQGYTQQQSQSQQPVDSNVYTQQQSYQQTYTPQGAYQAFGFDYTKSGQSYQSDGYEPEASESAKQGILSKMDEESSNQANSLEVTPVPDDDRIILNFGKLSEVPFYTTLPNREAAEAFARLQAAGSIASNYVDRIKAMEDVDDKDASTGEEESDDETHETLGLPQEELHKPQKVALDDLEDTDSIEEPQQEERVTVEVQKSIPLYETQYSATSLLDESGASDVSINLEEKRKEAFGQRIRPK